MSKDQFDEETKNRAARDAEMAAQLATLRRDHNSLQAQVNALQAALAALK